MSFDLEESIYVTSIKVYATEYEDYHEMELSLNDALYGGESNIYKKKFNGEFFNFEVKRFINGFGLSPSERVFKSAKITSISVRGIEQKYFSELIRILEDVSREKEKIESGLRIYLEKATKSFSDIEENERTIENQLVSIEENGERLDGLDKSIDLLNKQQLEIRKDIEIGTSVEKEGNERVASIKLNINDLSKQREAVSEEISNKQSQLRDLKENINLFPTEISGYVRQGTNNIKLYTILSFVPIVIISLVTYRLFSNSERLLNYFLDENRVGIVEFLISRAPYVIVSFTILTICYSVVHRLVSEIININRRRQDLFKISIIATDVSYASQDRMDLSNEEQYELRTQTKIEMLKEHLRMHMSEDYSYIPRQKYTEKLKSLIGSMTARKSDAALVENAEVAE
ncbi:hypothetical protein NKI19_30890 [Mesorhizobium sp. M0751]|uniref:hypothetical protein n=1 Tax=unclassified Mesorhizobium TaxID=325217 RepID=UPI00333B5768